MNTDHPIGPSPSDTTGAYPQDDPAELLAQKLHECIVEVQGLPHQGHLAWHTLSEETRDLRRRAARLLLTHYTIHPKG